MKLHAFGHSSFYLEIDSPAGEPVHILGDPWLSDTVIGDLMGRYPRVRWAGEIPPIDAIYLSHSHTDHLDPYSLVALWKQLESPPALLLPQSLAYLIPLFTEYLPGGEAIVLNEHEPVEFRGLAIRGLFNPETRGTNEDDVMMLLVENGRELFLGEADAVVPYGDPDTRAMVASLLEENPELETACFLAIKNELHVLMASVHAQSVDERMQLVMGALTDTEEEIRETFYPFSEEDDLWHDPRVVRLIGGQGICFPQALGTEWNRVLFPFPLSARAERERQVAAEQGLTVNAQAFEPGSAYEVSGGQCSEEKSPWLELLDTPDDIAYDPKRELFESFPDAPLRARSVAADYFEPRLLQVLNERFLPWWTGRRMPPVEHLLSAYEGQYRIRVRFGQEPEGHNGHGPERDYRVTFDNLRFHPAPVAGDAQEVYWASDLEDYLDGRCDDFSTFCRRPAGGDATHLWDCLGMPYLNNDLVEKKLKYHFERASAGGSIDEWVLAFYDFLR